MGNLRREAVRVCVDGSVCVYAYTEAQGGQGGESCSV